MKKNLKILIQKNRKNQKEKNNRRPKKIKNKKQIKERRSKMKKIYEIICIEINHPIFQLLKALLLSYFTLYSQDLERNIFKAKIALTNLSVIFIRPYFILQPTILLLSDFGSLLGIHFYCSYYHFQELDLKTIHVQVVINAP